MVPGSRLWATKGAKSLEFAVRTSLSREMKLNRDEHGGWRTIPSVDEVLTVVPAKNNPEKVEVLEFKAKTVLEIFDGVLAKQRERGLNPRLDAPLWKGELR